MRPRHPLIWALLVLTGALAFCTTQANAVPIHQHIKLHRPASSFSPARTVVWDTRKIDVAPPYVPPEPVYVPPPTTSYTAPAPTSSGGCPSYMAGEASSPDAVNPSSGASGCYQVLPSTAAAMGSACSDVNADSCVAAICAAQGNSAWSSSGATPCG